MCIFFFLVDSPLPTVRELCFSISFPLQNDQLANRVSGSFAKVADQGQQRQVRGDLDDFSAVQTVEAKVVMTFPLPGELSSSYTEDKK